ncbi:hypothetical protein JQ557_15520 [Bradyrhizobium sp. U87765 SZCCT0131]|uniref:cysteine rich repeat-containing protein n=1 Tax=unclassified Bradyrhizobium TaxID=2631580 RepID=UPI001BA6E9EB|nr:MULTISPECIES: cysteine rich repeat-containing protein [unclassified Bradyrhizobium]MBR1219412.1 hypothetical protein [Bradyrhizobium sp. U87765 SZCCT0131]MBR1262063.1 hypothetical protein [Bradyrhizobium sp. U87765 SZCCT0134]MBR1306084.1 hypothetical protein [Bradyrhizobium sp. U87765 SZCCT0110]MBR1317845.1 hypothetical protein [Bradyrhizobium sp. U87765 SZCCT0109]MBR1351547.1 hypothetical protein [Bradyrhizobium sp. U87765 SZCCT0048]
MHSQTRLSILSLVALAFGGLAPAGADDYRGTAAQQLACTPDVFRFCSSDIPDADRIVLCLRRNMPQLSTACHTVFDANASMTTADKPPAPAQLRPPSPRGHAAPPPAGVAPARPPVAAPPPSDDD